MGPCRQPTLSAPVGALENACDPAARRSGLSDTRVVVRRVGQGGFPRQSLVIAAIAARGGVGNPCVDWLIAPSTQRAPAPEAGAQVQLLSFRLSSQRAPEHLLEERSACRGGPGQRVFERPGHAVRIFVGCLPFLVAESCRVARAP
eukprot:15049115-Alexandrium_andersonii.AAC.1